MASYTEEFKQEAVRLYQSGKIGIDKTADRLGISAQTLRNWVKIYTKDDAAQQLVTHEQLRRLEREVARLKEENIILKKAAIFLGTRDDPRQ